MNEFRNKKSMSHFQEKKALLDTGFLITKKTYDLIIGLIVDNKK